MKRCSTDGRSCVEGQYTGSCIVCGHNVYMSKEEYLNDLSKMLIDSNIRNLENLVYGKNKNIDKGNIE